MDEEYEIRPLEAGDRVTGLSLGDQDFQPLKSYLKNEAKLHQAQSLARTLALFGSSAPTRVLGYMTLICGEIAASDAPQAKTLANGVIYRYPQFPVVKLARLAVDVSVKGNGQRWGSKFVDLATGIAKNEISPVVGCRFLVVDAKKKSVGFYKKTGFTLLDTPDNKARPEPVMYIDLLKVPGA